MKKINSEENSTCTVPILAWDFHYEFLNELKCIFADLKRVNEISNKFDWDEENLEIKERIKEEVVLITDVNLKIVFASKGIRKMTGYCEDEVLGKTPRIFQGPETCKNTLREIKEAIDLKIPFEKTIKNYRKNGQMYKCLIHGSPVFNLKGELSHFIAFEQEIKSA